MFTWHTGGKRIAEADLLSVQHHASNDESLVAHEDCAQYLIARTDGRCGHIDADVLEPVCDEAVANA